MSTGTDRTTHSFNSDQHFIELEIVERLRTIIVTSLERVVVKDTRV